MDLSTPEVAPPVATLIQSDDGAGRQPGPHSGVAGSAGAQGQFLVRGIEDRASAGDDATVDPGDGPFGVADLSPFLGLGDDLNGQARSAVFPQDAVVEARPIAGPNLVRFQRQPARHGLARGGGATVRHGRRRLGGGAEKQGGGAGQQRQGAATWRADARVGPFDPARSFARHL